MADDLSPDLLKHLHAVMFAIPPRDRTGLAYQWQMSPEWWQDVRRLEGRGGPPLWLPGIKDHLFGLPVDVSDEYGVPELVRMTDG